MAPKRLSDSDKQEILTLYRETQETTSTLASRYGVSNTTISRILKQTLSDDEYEALIQQKRIAGKSGGESSDASEDTLPLEVITPVAEKIAVPGIEPEISPVELPSTQNAPYRRQRKRSTVATTLSDEPVTEAQLPLDLIDPPAPAEPEAVEAPFVPEASPLQEILEEEIIDPEEDFEDDLEDDDLDDDEDEDDLDDDEDAIAEGLDEVTTLHVQSEGLIQVLPLSEASIPKTFYLVVDRASELITRPLKDFAELGQIPDEETQAKTLPIFDNHRVAKRFLRRMQRVVKVPDGKMLQKTSSYLQAKGITRLLIDGRIYSLN
ncbi:helix-turn-helix domain-containing protein [Oscillatoria sp. FACHB-1407]|uniref:helix-turn-helix domain-containing protein n=1 Tax=Oscillatoria sp. FACHB-1407 TaxID=2692847 RepID=UPI00168241A7|nr:helix-turn-helix domain-containing protein [Oscillatoria sp. FACHB-1407]MBD2460398.1 helix-turn-helix domain-containing protein [Oscillatoria sp. FACHB-1407]